MLYKALIYALSGSLNDAEMMLKKVIEEFESQTDFTDIALVYTALGKFEDAVKSLYKAYQKKSTNLCLVGADNRFDNLKSDKRFQELLQKMQLK
jgi:tetratricopeptide (TPR) repeat protein